LSNPALRRLLAKTGFNDVLASLTALSLSDLNSLLLELFRLKVRDRSVAELLNSYQKNRFVQPSSVDPLLFLEAELLVMKAAAQFEFVSKILSPLAPLGTCAVSGLADQNKIVSAVRGTEVVSDATNVLALEAVLKRKELNFNSEDVHYAASHRFVRAQTFSGKGFSAHFQVFCAVSAGKDRGHFLFEKDAAIKHLQLYTHFLIEDLKLADVKISIRSLEQEGLENPFASIIFEHVSKHFKDKEVSVDFTHAPWEEHRYYKDVRFSIDIRHGTNTYNVADGGFVSWCEKLSGNKKERMFTSGIGTEFLWKVINNRLT
jgi:hypothetical protein